MRSIGKCAFAGAALEEFDVPQKCTELAERAFWKCTKLVRVKLNSGLQTIGSQCFSWCRIAQLFVPNSVARIEAGAFSDCRALRSVTFQPGGSAVVDDSAFSGTGVEHAE